MQRRHVRERPDWRAQAAKVGFEVLTDDGQPYWDESVCYRFTLAQIEDDIEAPTQQLLGLCYQAVERILGDDALLRRFGIPETAWSYVRQTWQRQDKDLYGRFDLRYDGTGPAKLFEFNADTPTALFEAAVFQWQWLEQAIDAELIPGESDQFNSIHERLIDALGKFGIAPRTLHVACVRDHAEDRWTVEYLEDCARQAGLDTAFVHIEDIGLTNDGRFTDLDDRVITDLFKLYPWEWLLAESFGSALLADPVHLIEPAWKLALSNKGLLAVLWDMFPDHPALLPTYFEAAARPRGRRHPGRPRAARACRAVRCRGLRRPGRRGAAGLFRPVPGDRLVGDRGPGLRHRHPRGFDAGHRQHRALRAAHHPRRIRGSPWTATSATGRRRASRVCRTS